MNLKIRSQTDFQKQFMNFKAIFHKCKKCRQICKKTHIPKMFVHSKKTGHDIFLNAYTMYKTVCVA